MATFHPYLNFPGNTEEAFHFYKSVFGGEFGVQWILRGAIIQLFPFAVVEGGLVPFNKTNQQT